jgi:hypothetical protein
MFDRAARAAWRVGAAPYVDIAVSSPQIRSLADFIVTTSEFKFSVHTPGQQGPGKAGDARCKSDPSKYRDPVQPAPHTIPAQRPPQRSGTAHPRSNAAAVPAPSAPKSDPSVALKLALKHVLMSAQSASQNKAAFIVGVPWVRAAHAFSYEGPAYGKGKDRKSKPPPLTELQARIGVSYRTVLRIRDVIEHAARKYCGIKPASVFGRAVS